MNVEDHLRAGMRELADDYPTDVMLTTQSLIARRQKSRRNIAVIAAVSAVAAIGAIMSLSLHSNTSTTEVGVSHETSRPPSAEGSRPSAGAPTESSVTTTVDTDVSGSSAARCYATADIGRNDNYMAFSTSTKSGSASAAPSALDYCKRLWDEGTLADAKPYVRPTVSSPGHDTPHLVACVLSADISDENLPEVAVFPGGEHTCADLNLPRYTG